jgi:hypothetical protein
LLGHDAEVLDDVREGIVERPQGSGLELLALDGIIEVQPMHVGQRQKGQAFRVFNTAGLIHPKSEIARTSVKTNTKELRTLILL